MGSPRKAAVSPSRISAEARGQRSVIRSGTVAFNDHYFHMHRVAEVARESGMKAALAWCVFGIGKDAEVGPGLEGTVEWIAETHHTAGGRLRTFLGPHSPYICPPEFLERVVAIAHETGQGIHLHLAEDEGQVQQSLERYGVRPVQYVDRLGVFDVPGGCVAAHCLPLCSRGSCSGRPRRPSLPRSTSTSPPPADAARSGWTTCAATASRFVPPTCVT